MFDLTTCDLRKLNSLTKYPSILTYHKIDPSNGKLFEELNFDFGTNSEGSIHVTEKIDGTNARVIITPDGYYVIGSREELLYAKGDLIGNPALGIVSALKEHAELILEETGYGVGGRMFMIYYFEVFGGSTTSTAKNYRVNSSTISFRELDRWITFSEAIQEILEMPIEKISSLRDHDQLPVVYQAFFKEDGYAPYLLEVKPDDMPKTISDTYDWLKALLPETHCKLEEGALGRPEGVVIRNINRTKIAKIRFEDYERTLGIRRK